MHIGRRRADNYLEYRRLRKRAKLLGKKIASRIGPEIDTDAEREPVGLIS